MTAPFSTPYKKPRISQIPSVIASMSSEVSFPDATHWSRGVPSIYCMTM